MSHPTHPENHCPTCRHKLNRACSAEPGTDHKPRPNDVTVCIGCGEYLVFDQQLCTRVMNLGDFQGLDASTQDLLVKTRSSILALRRTLSEN